MTYQGLIFRWSEVANIPQSLLAGDVVPQVSDDASWRKWAALEATKRIILGHCVTDGTISALFGVSPAARYTLHPVLLASDDQSFLASTLESCIAVLPRSQPTTLSSFIGALLSAGQLPLIPPSPLNIQTVLECLNALVSDWDKSNGCAIGLTPATSLAKGLARLFPLIKAYPVALARWHAVSIYSAETFWRLDSATPFQESPFARRALLHAVALRVMAEQLPIATSTFPDFTLPVSFFRGAMTLTKLPPSIGHSDNQPQLNLDLPIDWEELGLWGFVVEDNPSAMSAHKRFVLLGGNLSSRGALITYHDVQPFTAILSVFGRVWPASETCAAAIDEVLW
jgi:hypothetical protein